MEKKKGHHSNKIKKSGRIKKNEFNQLLPNNHKFKVASSELPESFFESMVLTEIDLSQEFSMDKFYKLINLYSEALEFYTTYDPLQAKYFKGRMESLLTKRDTLIRLKRQGQNTNKKEENNINLNNNELNLNNNNSSNILNKSELKNKIELHKDALIYDDISKQVNKFMNINKDTQNNPGIEIIKEDLKKQNEKWKAKLKKKKKNMLRYSYNFKLKHQKGMSLDIMNSHSSDDAKNIKINYAKDNNDINLDKFNKKKNLFNQNIIEEVKEDKEENEDEENDNDNENNLEENNDINEINEIKMIELDTNLLELNDNKDINKGNINNENIKEKKNIKEEGKEKEKEGEVEIDEKILTSVNEKIDLLNKLIDDIENNKFSKEDEEDTILEDDDIEKIKDIVKVPLKFQSAYFSVEELINKYISQFNNIFFKEIFEQFAQNLKDIYDTKYKKYIEVSLEYHHQIKENEHILENHDDFSEEKKEEIQQIIDSLKDEQQNQIAKIEDEFNRLIVSKVNEFKIDSFKNNSSILLIEEKLKLDIYSIINESFYKN